MNRGSSKSDTGERIAVVYHDATQTIDWKDVPNQRRFRYAATLEELAAAVEAAGDLSELVVIDAQIEPRQFGEVARLMRSVSAEVVMLRKQKAWVGVTMSDGERHSFVLEAKDIASYLDDHGLAGVDEQPRPTTKPAAAPLATVLPPHEGATSREELVLVADDDRRSREHAGDMLRSLGFSVVLAGTGLEAVRLAQSHKPATIVLDGLMPEMHGFEVARLIRHLDPGYAPRILAVTAIYKALRYQSEAKLKYGIDAYLIKPLTPEVITAALWSDAA